MGGKRNGGGSKNRQQKKKPSLTVLKWLLIAIIVAAAALCLPVFKISAVDIIGLQNVPRETIMNALQEEIGNHILRVDKQAAEERIRKITYVADAAVRTKFPNRLEVTVRETTLVGYIKFTGGIVGIDGTGKVIETEQEQNASVPVVQGIKVNTFVVGEPIEVAEQEKLEAALTCLNAIESNGLMSTVSAVDITDLQEILLFTPSGVVAKCGSEDQMAYKIAMFASVVPQIDLQRSGTVDLRIVGQAIYDIA